MRSKLFVPGSRPELFAKALAGAADAISFDVEDSVPEEFERERSGRGQFVGVSLLRSALTMQSARMIWAEGEALDIWRDMRSGGITGLHPTLGSYRGVARPIKFGRTPGPEPFAAPALGQDTGRHCACGAARRLDDGVIAVRRRVCWD